MCYCLPLRKYRQLVPIAFAVVPAQTLWMCGCRASERHPVRLLIALKQVASG